MSGTQDEVGAVEQEPLRRAISAACRLPEPDCIAALLPLASLPPEARRQAQTLAEALVQALRARKPNRLAALLGAYPLGSEEGQALMGVAEALLRIPDTGTRDELLRDKLAGRHWHATPALRLAALLASTRLWLLAAPAIRRAAQHEVRAMADGFVLGETMQQALPRTWPGFRYSYDMLGEAALTEEDATAYEATYAQAINSARTGGDVYENDGVSIKLSALFPRYSRTRQALMMAGLVPRLIRLAQLTKARNIGFTIDAEEADRLDLSLDLLQILCHNETLKGWHGLGIAVQAYQKRAPAVLDFCIHLARASGHRLMLRLVKGAYWDSEIKQAQIAGHEDYPVFTRKAHTDISYLACARKLLDAGEDIFPQFATHNTLTIATIHAMAGSGPYEFQCLHGMGEDLYQALRAHSTQPCRIYAPVGQHASLLPYLSRRLLENGANTSFVNRLHSHSVPVAEILRDPLDETLAASIPGAPHPAIPLPANLFGPARRNSTGLDLADEPTLRLISAGLAQPLPAMDIPQATADSIGFALAQATSYTPPPPATRQALLLAAAEAIAASRLTLLNFLTREAYKPIEAALAEIREAEDYCRYYAAQILDWQESTHIPLGPVACISPWNFPLAIFLGQIAGAFAAGNAVLAKPAEETPSIAAYVTSLLHQSGFPPGALHLLQGDGGTGAALVADARVHGVVFTGSLAVARAIAHTLSQRTNPGGQPVPLVAETGGQNALIADSSALPEQLITDTLYSAFDSAGQRCSALRLLCLQRELAPLVLPRLRAAVRELQVGNPAQLCTDLGPVITAEARDKILAHIEACRAAGYSITQGQAPVLPHFVPPTLIEIPDITMLREEIFGPVLHVLAVRAKDLPDLPHRINALGYGLTGGLHSRVTRRALRLAGALNAGNIYINRNMVGAVVGVQPFGGQGLSGTGPKAGGPLYVHRLLKSGPACWPAQGDLPGPAGERNLYRLQPCRVYCSAQTAYGRAAQQEAVRAAGASVTFSESDGFSVALLEGGADDVRNFTARLVARPGPLIPIHALSTESLAAGAIYNPAWLVHERSVSINTAAAGGNAALMAAITP